MRIPPRRVLPVLLLVLLTFDITSLVAQDAGKARKGGRGEGKAKAAAANPWWNEIDTGPFISDTFFLAREGEVAALKGIAIKLGAARDVSVLFDTELLAWRAGFDGAVVLEGTPWNGSHGGNSHVPGGDERLFFVNPSGLGIGVNGGWADTREPKSGPLPHDVGRYRGLFRHGRQVVLHYTVAGVNVLERPALETVAGVGGARAITRTVNVAATPDAALEFLVRAALPIATDPENASGTVDIKGASDASGGTSALRRRLKREAQVYLVGAPAGVTLEKAAGGRTTVRIARGTGAVTFKIVHADRALDAAGLATIAGPVDLAPLTRGGPGLFPQTFAVQGQLDPEAATKTYAVDVVPLPAENPWKSPPRFGGFDFLPGGKRVAASTWNGDVWIADGIDGNLATVTWRRFASGMFQTLGLKVVDGTIYTQGRDQITRLHDLNGDGEADHYECFNNDVRITDGFHEFAFDLQTDRAGNFYFSKAMPVNQGGRGFSPWTPHNGTVMKVSKDGAKLEVVARGLRAPGGVGVSPDGVVTTGENEGSWVPACKISWTPPGKVTFNGVVPGKWENRGTWMGPLPGAPTDYDRPLVWLPYYADNSSGSQAWVPENTTWDARHAGEMLHLSYGKSSIFRVLREEVNGVMQGGVYRLPIDVSAAVMRARFHPENGQLYIIGFRGWQTNGRDAFQRVRFTGVTTPLPVGLHAHRNGVLVRFSAPLDPRTAGDPSRYSISKWNYVWGPQYGSGRFSIDQRDAAAEEKALSVPSKGAHNIIDTVTVGAAKLVEDGRAVFLYLPKMTAAMQMELKLDLTDMKGAAVRETIYSTVHEMAPEYKIPGVRWEDVRVAESAPVGEPGLVMSFNAEITDTVRVDQLALTVPAGASPSVFVGSARGGGFGAAFQGTLVVPERDEYTFSLEGAGTVSLQIDGKMVVSGELPVTAGSPVTLAKGPHAIYCSYSSPTTGEARVRLMWSSPQFRVEPVPAAMFRHIPGAELESWSKVRAGREVFVAAQCIKCHAPRGGMPRDASPEIRIMAPDFNDMGDRIDRGWLERWIAQPQGHCPTIAAADAANVAGYLVGLRGARGDEVNEGVAGGGAPAADGIPRDVASIAAGASLVEKLNLGFWIEPLMRARKYTDRGLVGFLAEPARHHADTVFPDVRLTREEARQIAAYVRSRQPGVVNVASTAPGDAQSGQTIVASMCVRCHDAAPVSGDPSRMVMPVGTRGSFEPPGFETMSRSDWTVKGCVAEHRGSAPDLRLTREEKALLVAFRNADRDVGLQSLRRFAPAEYAANQMKALNCAECHSGKNKLPDIALAGEKLTTNWLAHLLSGKQPTKTRPWIEARMPAFANRAGTLATGLAARHGVPLTVEAALDPDASMAALGERIAGAEGYSCIACHDAGTRKALQVFEGQGPNLQHAAGRLRYDYYQRWMHWPQRIAPTTIMPRYTKDRDHALLEAHFGGKAEKQFEAVWLWMQSLRAGDE